jgi:hypothetical protein
MAQLATMVLSRFPEPCARQLLSFGFLLLARHWRVNIVWLHSLFASCDLAGSKYELPVWVEMFLSVLSVQFDICRQEVCPALLALAQP